MPKRYTSYTLPTFPSFSSRKEGGADGGVWCYTAWVLDRSGSKGTVATQVRRCGAIELYESSPACPANHNLTVGGTNEQKMFGLLCIVAQR